jgi:hypothetical protein
MTAIKQPNRRLSRIGLALGALIAVAVVAGPAAAGDRWDRHRDHGYFSFGYSAPAYRYYPPPRYYYYPPPPPAYYYPPPAYYGPPPPRYYDPPGASFRFVVPFRD